MSRSNTGLILWRYPRAPILTFTNTTVNHSQEQSLYIRNTGIFKPILFQSTDDINMKGHSQIIQIRHHVMLYLNKFKYITIYIQTPYYIPTQIITENIHFSYDNLCEYIRVLQGRSSLNYLWHILVNLNFKRTKMNTMFGQLPVQINILGIISNSNVREIKQKLCIFLLNYYKHKCDTYLSFTSTI